MPELPEVETVARVLAPQLRGCMIDGVGVRRPEVIAHPDAAGFCTGLTGRTIADLTRRGKYLLLLLTQGGRVAVHLRMTGCLLLAPADRAELPHTHVVFRLRDGRELRFSDARRFGRLWLLQGDGDDACAGMRKLGLEPFDRALTAEYLRARLGERRRTIKACLLGQDTVAGISNIYADEILFSAGICPLRPADSLRAAEWARLAAAIPERLAFFVQRNMLTPEEYLNDLMTMRYSRIPVCKGETDNIIGILHIKDYLIQAWEKGFDGVEIASIIRKAYFVPETKNIDSLLYEMQRTKQQIAILIDEYGGFSGIVTMEDIIEQVVGDIDDEYDEEEEIIDKIDDNIYLVDGDVDLDDLDEELGIDLVSETSETIGGFIIDMLGEIPDENDVGRIVEFENYQFKIMAIQDRRIERVKIYILPKETEENSASESDEEE